MIIAILFTMSAPPVLMLLLATLLLSGVSANETEERHQNLLRRVLDTSAVPDSTSCRASSVSTLRLSDTLGNESENSRRLKKEELIALRKLGPPESIP